MTPTLNKVFFHEVGHFVAHELNFRNFGIGEVDQILLLEKNVNGRKEYEGQTIPKIPEGYSKNQPLINLPEKIAELVYGCYFQSLYLDQKLENCFNHKNSSFRGYKDFNDLICALSEFKTSVEVRRELYPFLQQEYYEYLTTIKATFALVFDKNPEDFLLKTGLGFSVDIVKMKSSLEDFLILHTKEFLEFVNRIKEILKWKNGG